MNSNRKSRSEIPMEQDSFLDIVANLVGILIILVVIFGAQIGESLTVKRSPETVATLEGLESQRQQLTEQNHVLQQREAENRDWQTVIDQQETLIQQRRLERHIALQQLAAIQHEVELKIESLSEQQQAEVKLREQLTNQAAEIQDLRQEIESVRQASLAVEEEPAPEVIEHYPTPIAQTVFGREVHFHLRDNKVLFVPFDELVQKLRATWETHAENLPVGQSTTETLGPIGDFRLQYELGSEEKTLPTINGTVVTRVVSLNRFWLLPIQSGLGEPVEEALKADSQFAGTIKKYAVQDTTVSIWVYPESYASFLELRKQLTRQGYRVAVWPLTSDQKISGSPEGLRATSQ
ncbi:MAG: hypothetical protein JNL67_12425 [Planctomycetaceae bacterium]|nr:hypothetical protein [Planctomycetaceae bacterium]